MFVLPMFTIGATIGLIMLEQITSLNLLLNGLAIVFITELDDSIGQIFLLGYQDEGEPSDPLKCLPFSQLMIHRFQALLLVVAMIITIAAAENIVPMFGDESVFVGDDMSCSDIREGAV